jgi:hypothetical protein
MDKQICAWCIHAMVISIWNGIFPNLKQAAKKSCDICGVKKEYTNYHFDTQENYEKALVEYTKQKAWANGGAKAYMRAMGQ